VLLLLRYGRSCTLLSPRLLTASSYFYGIPPLPKELLRRSILTLLGYGRFPWIPLRYRILLVDSFSRTLTVLPYGVGCVFLFSPLSVLLFLYGLPLRRFLVRYSSLHTYGVFGGLLT